MSRIQEKLLLALADFVALNLSTMGLLWTKHFLLRAVRVGGMLDSAEQAWRQTHGVSSSPTLFFVVEYYSLAIGLIYVLWLVLFVSFGLYRTPRLTSRFDEAIAVLKAITVGTVLFVVATLDGGFSFTRVLMGIYWVATFVLVAGGRFGVRSIQQYLVVSGIGRRRAVIIGSEARGVRLLHSLREAPSEGYDIIGFVGAKEEATRDEVEGIPVLGEGRDLKRILVESQVDSVLIALKSNSHEEVLAIVEAGRGLSVSFSITPDLYDIVMGHVRTSQIHGVPLMELKPHLMAPGEMSLKRAMDFTVASIVLLGLSPLWLLIALLIKLDSRGPVLFRQERVGERGRIFTMYKFRSMIEEAESGTGPVWVSDDDPRITRMGRLLRMLHLDESPQCINFVKGDMSLVGPRPERPYFVERFSNDIPLYTRRFNVKPGLLGWAQSKHEFDLNSKDFARIAEERLEYDLYYIENMSLALDFRIMLRTIWFVLAGKSTR